MRNKETFLNLVDIGYRLILDMMPVLLLYPPEEVALRAENQPER